MSQSTAHKLTTTRTRVATPRLGKNLLLDAQHNIKDTFLVPSLKFFYSLFAFSLTKLPDNNTLTLCFTNCFVSFLICEKYRSIPVHFHHAKTSMSAFLRFIVRLCCDPEKEEEDEQFRRQRGSLVIESSSSPVVVVESTPMSRSGIMTMVSSSAASGGTYQPILPVETTPQQQQLNPHEHHHHDNDDNENDDGEDCCCQGKYSSSPNSNDHGLHEFFRKIRERWRRYDSMESFRPISSSSSAKENLKAGLSPLRTASSYDASSDIPTISLDEVVLPGSELQQQMARAMSLNLEKQDDECVICMEGFDPTNPRMPTQCGCGRNKTYFHLPCLYQWIEQSEDCPSCRQKLRWEEF